MRCLTQEFKTDSLLEDSPPVPFVVGIGRSGTTLLRLMLDAHPDLAVPPETYFIPQVALACKHSLSPSETFLETLSAHERWPDFDLSLKRLTAEIQSLNPFALSRALRTFYQLYAERFGKSRWGDKTPDYKGNMLLIQQLLPEARFIHLIRDGRDVALSVKDLFFGPNSVSEAAMWWETGIKETRYKARKIHHYLEVHYEDLVLSPERMLRKICEFIELEWNPLMLDYYRQAPERIHEMKAEVHSDHGIKVTLEERWNIFQFTSKPPDDSRVHRWKREMSQADQVCFERQAGRLLHELGYELTTDLGECSQTRLWVDRVGALAEELDRLVGPNESVILVDQDELDLDSYGVGFRVIPFLEHNEQYWGPPADDETAIREVERLRQAGAALIVFGWPAFWWLDYYSELNLYLRAKFRCVLHSDRLVVFNLRSGVESGSDGR